MTPKLPSSSDGPNLPPRQRKNLPNLSWERGEEDFWSLEEDEGPAAETIDSVRKSSEPTLPTTRVKGNKKRTSSTVRVEIDTEMEGPPPAPVTSSPGKNQVTVNLNVNVKGKRNRATNSRAGSSKTPSGAMMPRNELGDLDGWELPEADGSPAGAEPPAPPELSADLPMEAPEIQSTEPEPAEPASEAKSVENVSEAPQPEPNRWNFTKFEKLGLLMLSGLLLVAFGVVVATIYRLPDGKKTMTTEDFPVSGKLVTVNSATTYWRAPIRTGERAETVRRGTELIPVVDLQLQGGPGAIRLFFKDADGKLIGDAVTTYVKGKTKLQLAATAGFDDLGMHAAYRTGQTPPWTLEILEGASETAPGESFKKLFDLKISIDRR